ncbi:MAG: MBOAT family protein, partial [Spirochaetia bacterium]|nr:MBOAT family protein [Spirochaetia bacterium]
MIFSSISFFVFFIIVLLAMALTNLGARTPLTASLAARRAILLVASYVFYGWWDWRFCLLMLALSVIAGYSALKNKRAFLIIGIVAPLVTLGFFKYFNFFVASFTAAFGLQNSGALRIILPVGISFYTFQSMSYTIDVYRKKLPAVRDFSKLALYIAFFPQLVAGPIIKAADFLPQLEENRNVNLKNLKIGMQIFLFGLFKKIVIADRLSVFVDDVFRTPKAFHAVTLILALISYAIQIYFDFSGYSDMAIGCAKCLGYDFNRNFNLPYISRNISEFWKRWHISLSSWLQEYLYIPLGGNRRGVPRTYLNLFLTMLLGGLWHGASWTFVLWGAAHGIALCIHRFLKRKTFNARGKIYSLASCLLTNVFVCFCWVLFRADTFSTASDIFTGIFSWQNGIMQIYSWSVIAIIFLAAGSIAAVLKQKNNPLQTTGLVSGFYPILDLEKFWQLVLFFVAAGG